MGAASRLGTGNQTRCADALAGCARSEDTVASQAAGRGCRAYALSPIDLIPDFIPVLGYLDYVLLVPVGIWLAVTLIPAARVVELRARAEVVAQRPVSRGAAMVVVVIWIAAALGLGLAAWMMLKPHFGH